MKLVSKILNGIDGAEIYAVIAMLLFLAMFIAVGVWLLKLRKGYFDKASMLPLEDDDQEINDIELSNH